LTKEGKCVTIVSTLPSAFNKVFVNSVLRAKHVFNSDLNLAFDPSPLPPRLK
jgi:hypothetical protein